MLEGYIFKKFPFHKLIYVIHLLDYFSLIRVLFLSTVHKTLMWDKIYISYFIHKFCFIVVRGWKSAQADKFLKFQGFMASRQSLVKLGEFQYNKALFSFIWRDSFCCKVRPKPQNYLISPLPTTDLVWSFDKIWLYISIVNCQKWMPICTIFVATQ